MRDVIAGLNHFIDYADKTRKYTDAGFYEDCKAEIEQLRARLSEARAQRDALVLPPQGTLPALKALLAKCDALSAENDRLDDELSTDIEDAAAALQRRGLLRG